MFPVTIYMNYFMNIQFGSLEQFFVLNIMNPLHFILTLLYMMSWRAKLTYFRAIINYKQLETVPPLILTKLINNRKSLERYKLHFIPKYFKGMEILATSNN